MSLAFHRRTAPVSAPKRSKFALNERTAPAPHDRTGGSRGQQNRRRREPAAEIERDVSYAGHC